MAIQKVEVTLKGKSALLMHKFPLIPLEAAEKKSVEEQAEYVAYRDEETRELFIPGIAIQRALINGAVYSKGKGRASLQKVAAACLMVSPERVGLGTTEYKIDTRPVVVPSTRGRILRHRPKLEEWQAFFDLEYEDTLLSEPQVRRIVDDTCERVGFLEFRPACKGSFGRAMVVEWKPLK